MKHALFVWGGWEGHTPRKTTEIFASWLAESDFDVLIRDRLEAFDDIDLLRAADLIVPNWTMGTLSPDQERNLCQAVAAGAGLAGWHGGMGDAFRTNTAYQHMVGGQFVAHPGDLLPAWNVRITDAAHPITAGLADFTMRNTERYYLHVDPGNHVLATTPMDGGFDMPVAWTRTWGRGRVAYVSIGHTFEDFAVAEARTLVQRSLLWAARS